MLWSDETLFVREATLCKHHSGQSKIPIDKMQSDGCAFNQAASTVSFNPIALVTATKVERRGLPRADSAL